MTVTTERVLAEANLAHATSWHLQGRLSGGYQSGAHLLADPRGRRAVLKWTDSREWAPTVVAAAPVVASARAAGWPTPRWLAVGTVDGYPYQVQDLVEGTSQEAITHDWLDLILPVVALQSGLGSHGMRNWSSYDHAVVFGAPNDHRRGVIDSGPAGTLLSDVVTRLNRHHEGATLPAGDLVHGDLNPDNVLVADGRLVALIDVEAVGRGSRLHDLATLVLYDWLWGDQAVQERLLLVCRDIAEPGWLEISLSAVTIDLLAFGVRHWPSQDLAAACRAAADLLTALDT